MFNNKVILITGGTGSFGNEFLKILLKKYKPKKIIIYSRDEFKQFMMRENFSVKKYPCLRYFLGDVRDLERLKMAMNGCDFVIHAAALKQVPTAEYNPMEFVKTNINGAENVIHAAISQKVNKIIALSTDKAANPINLYGATKLASDKIFIAANNIVGNQKTKFSVVRYGNVFASRGSVVPYFKRLLSEKKNFLPITDKRMTRFFITLDEGVNFVIQSFKSMIGGEIFIPKIPSIKIIDLAKAMAPNVKIKEIGIRPGEKIHELMCPNESAVNTIEFKNYFVIYPNSTMFDDKRKIKLINSNGLGKKVDSSFEYSSDKNHNFLSIKEIKKLLKS
tara:strand:- start:231 stop:1232 length:1002 start_codon:yes stop_codon:yes gene_type:complete